MGKGNTVLSFEQLANITGRKSGKAVPEKFLDSSLLSNLHPTVKGRFEIWATPDQAKGLETGVEIFFKTKGKVFLLNRNGRLSNIPKKNNNNFFQGDTPFLEKVWPTSIGQFSGREGGEVLNQIVKLSNVYEKDGKLKQDEMEGVSPEEWGKLIKIITIC